MRDKMNKKPTTMIEMTDKVDIDKLVSVSTYYKNPSSNVKLDYEVLPNGNQITAFINQNVPIGNSRRRSTFNRDGNESSQPVDNEKRFQEEKGKRERDELNNIIKESKKKNLKSITKKILTLSEILMKQRIKTIDFIIAFLILVNIILAFVSNNIYTSADTQTICNTTIANNTNTTRILITQADFKFDKNIVEPNYQITHMIIANTSNVTDNTTSPVIQFNNSDCSYNYTVTTKEGYTSDSTVTSLRIVCIVVVVIIELFLFYRYYLKLKVLRVSYLACSQDNIFTTGLYKYLILEFIVLGIFSPPGLDGIFKGSMLFGVYTYSYDSLIDFLMLFKLYYFYRIYANVSIWASDRVIQIGIDHKISIGAYFAIKAQIKHSPYLSMIIMFAFSVGIFGFMMRIFEYGYSSDPGAAVGVKAVSNPNFKTYTDTFWVIIITMMTVGYGDIYPNTHMGRFIAFLSAVVGMLIVSLLIVSLSYVVEFSPEEKKAHNLIKKLEANTEMNKFSATYVKSIMRLFLIKKSDMHKENTEDLK